MKNYILRTIVEEVFPLARISNPAKLLAVMEKARHYVSDMRILSLLLEEPIVTFSFFGLFRLGLSVGDYSTEARRLVQKRLGPDVARRVLFRYSRS